MKVNGGHELFGLPTFFKISSFVFSRTKIYCIQVWNNLRVS